MVDTIRKNLITGVLLVITVAVYGQVKLPALIGDGMVLQRESGVKIWGWDKGGKSVSVEFLGNTYESAVNDEGKWEIALSNLKAGGPFPMKIKGTTEINLVDILIGDVWVCSGQSNMELNMRRASPLYGQEILNSTNDLIRYFAAPQTYNFNEPQTDYKGGRWKKTNPESVLDFGAIAYFFAREINSKYDVPVGIINTAIGGTPTEAWVSEDAIKAFPDHYNELLRFKDKALIDQIEKDNREKPQACYKELGQKDEGYRNAKNKWTDPSISTEDWPSMEIPGYWANTPLGPVNGVVWFRRTFEVPASLAGKPARLLLGSIVDADSVFVNSSFTGTTGYQYPPRRYEIPPQVLREGKNTIVVRIINTGGMGGFVPDKPYQISIDSHIIDLKGSWQYRCGAIMKPLPGGITVKYKPVGLFNAMISPLLQFSIKGVLWYQGESNAERPIEQRKIFPVLISDWRSNWAQGDFPFLFVQLPNFMASKTTPSESNWALFREAQLQALSVPNTAMAVTIDVGEWNDIHPLNKLDVANRLAVAADKIAYGNENIVYSGPLYSSMKISKNKVVLTFNHTGSGLISKDSGPLKQFSIAGSDKKFVWADAEIKKNKVIVGSRQISQPVAVRYAWADNPEGANLYNSEGLPASPFRTDNW